MDSRTWRRVSHVISQESDMPFRHQGEHTEQIIIVIPPKCALQCLGKRTGRCTGHWRCGEAGEWCVGLGEVVVLHIEVVMSVHVEVRIEVVEGNTKAALGIGLLTAEHAFLCAWDGLVGEDVHAWHGSDVL